MCDISKFVVVTINWPFPQRQPKYISWYLKHLLSKNMLYLIRKDLLLVKLLTVENKVKTRVFAHSMQQRALLNRQTACETNDILTNIQVN